MYRISIQIFVLQVVKNKQTLSTFKLNLSYSIEGETHSI